MSTPTPETPRPVPTQPNPNPQPMQHGGRPDNGMHVPSSVPGAGAYDCSGAVGSNIVPAAPSVPAAASDDVLDAPPPAMGYPSAQTWNPSI